MHFSVLTTKGQTTIPKEIRDYLHMKNRDKIIYVLDGERVFLSPLRGTILDLKGIVKRHSRKPVDFHELRELLKENAVKEIREEMK